MLNEKIDQLLETLRPAMQVDGGGVELVRVEGSTVFVRLLGTCLACPSASLTLKFGIERTLREQCPEIKEVIRVE